MKKFYTRFTSETSDFFKPIVKICASLAVLGTAIQAVPTTYGLPVMVYTIAGYCIAAGIFGAAIAQSTVKTPEKL
jgi:hypothetical protein